MHTPRLTRRGALLCGAGALTAVGAVAATPDIALGRRARTSSSFIDSVGIQVHLSYSDTPYVNIERVTAALSSLGVVHVRDDLRLNRPDQYRALSHLADVGIGSDLILGDPGEPPPADYVAVASQIPRVENLEGPNEWDMGGPAATWPQEVYERQAQLYAATRSSSAMNGVPVLAPAMAFLSSLPALAAAGPLGSISDTANVHAYPGGRPVTAVLGDTVAAVKQFEPNKPFYVTESGYHNALNAPNAFLGHTGIPESLAASYVLTLLLENYRAGVDRTFLYELIDQFSDPGLVNPESHFGLLRLDLTTKPAYRSLRTLLRLAEDTAKPFRAQALGGRLRGPRGLRSLVLHKSDGSHLVALWRDVSQFDTRSQTPVAVEADTVRLSLDERRPVRVYKPVSGWRPVVDTVARRLDVQLGGAPVILVVDGSRNTDYRRPINAD